MMGSAAFVLQGGLAMATKEMVKRDKVLVNVGTIGHIDHGVVAKVLG
jgi:hypothetical protein